MLPVLRSDVGEADHICDKTSRQQPPNIDARATPVQDNTIAEACSRSHEPRYKHDRNK